MRGLKLRGSTIILAAVAFSMLFAGPALAHRGDANHDRIPDRWEKRHGLSLKVKQAGKDQDRDGADNLCEYQARTDPRDADTDGDRRVDGQEDFDRDHVDGADESDVNNSCADRDTDNDKVRDGSEDPDDDGLDNAHEDRSANDPDDADTDDDGVEDGDERAGKVVSRVGDVVTIQLVDGATLSGRVDASTEVKCESERDHEDADEQGGEESGEAPAKPPAGEEPVSKANGTPGVDDTAGDGEADEDGDAEEGKGDDAHACSLADLVVDAAVHEAEMELTADRLYFTEIELVA